MVVFPPNDTARFELPARTEWCTGGRGLLLESLNPEGSGVLLRLRYRDSLTSDSMPIVAPSDTTTTPAATVGVKFFSHDTPRGYALDSGQVQLRRDADVITVTASGSGIENAIRIHARIEAQGVPLGTDSVPCDHSP